MNLNTGQPLSTDYPHRFMLVLASYRYGTKASMKTTEAIAKSWSFMIELIVRGLKRTHSNNHNYHSILLSIYKRVGTSELVNDNVYHKIIK